MSYRNLEVNGDNWTFKVGKKFLDIRDPRGRGYRPTIAEVIQPTIDAATDINNALDIRLYEVRPQQIRAYIEQHIGPQAVMKKGKGKG